MAMAALSAMIATKDSAEEQRLSKESYGKALDNGFLLWYQSDGNPLLNATKETEYLCGYSLFLDKNAEYWLLEMRNATNAETSNNTKTLK
jgi:hypothetical protein